MDDEVTYALDQLNSDEMLSVAEVHEIVEIMHNAGITWSFYLDDQRYTVTDLERGTTP